MVQIENLFPKVTFAGLGDKYLITLFRNFFEKLNGLVIKKK
jgi:hypothetical protein